MARTPSTRAPSRPAPRPARVPQPEPETVEEQPEEPATEDGDEAELDHELEARKAALVDEAMQHEVVLDPDRDYSIEELEEMVETAKAAEQEAHEEAQKAAEAARKPLPQAEGDKGASGRVGPRAKPGRKTGFQTVAANIPQGNPELCAQLKLPELTDADRTLAASHGYPVAIPGARAYRSSVPVRCIFGGGVRPIGSVILLIDAHTKNKREYLTPLD